MNKLYILSTLLLLFTSKSIAVPLRIALIHNTPDQKVAMVRGMKYAEIGLKAAGVEKVGILSDVGEMMSMLQLDFIDFAISSRFNGMVQIKLLGMDSIKPNSSSLDKLKLYHYLHIKHKHLVPEIDTVIKSMKKSGELNKLKKQFQQDLLNNLN